MATTSAIANNANAYKIMQVGHGGSVSTIKVSAGKCIQTATRGVMGCGIFPTENTFVDNLLPARPMKEEIDLVLIVQDVPSVPVSKNYAFLKFNLSSVIPKAIFTSHARPLNASLWLYAQYATGFINASVRAYHVPSNAWNEDTLTWNNMPPVDLTHFDSNQIRAINRWYKWNVTTDIANDIQGNGTSSFALIAGFTSWSNYAWFTSKENITYPPELDVYFREPTLTLVTSFPHQPITIDGDTNQTDSTGTIEMRVPWGPHKVTVADTIPVQNGVRELFVGWSDNVSSPTREVNIGNNLTLHANYEKQYRLNATSPYATTSGTGWYFPGQRANVSVQATWLFSEGLLGFFGVRRVFDHWTGACTTSQPDCTLPMNEPKETTAVWREDYTVTIAVSAIVAIAVVVLSFRIKRRRRAR